VVEYLKQDPYDATVRLDKPGPGVAALGAFTFPGGTQTMVAMNFYMYGDQASDTVARVTPVWEKWLTALFPMTVE
jgi:hypothetical protein